MADFTSLTSDICPAINTIGVEAENSFFSSGRSLDAHQIGWLISGVCAVVATAISIFTIVMHCRNYTVRREQRQIIRILLMPAFYSVVSFFSYRYYREYSYYAIVLSVMEALVLASFLMLLLEYIGSSTDEQKLVLQQKGKEKIPFPFCCIRFRPSKPYFLHALRGSVLQYVFFRPMLSVAAIVTNYYGVLCPTIYSIHFAALWLDSIDFVSISIALYGLIVFYALVRKNLKGQSPLKKFLSIKFIILITFYQGFVFSILQSHNVIKATQYWTSSNVADGLQALAICCEMVIFSIVFIFSFSWQSYLVPHGQPKTSPFRPFLDALNLSDLAIEAWHGFIFMIRFILGRPDTRASSTLPKSETGAGFDIDQAFRIGHDDEGKKKGDEGQSSASETTLDDGMEMRERNKRQEVDLEEGMIEYGSAQ